MASYQKLELKEVVVEPQTESLISKEDLLKKLREAIASKDEYLFHRCIDEVEKLVQDNDRRRELLDATGTLVYAVYVGFHPAVETVIQKGADVNAMSAMPEDPEDSDKKRTPLHWAADRGDVDTVRYLFDKGAEINIKDSVGDTPLNCAAWRGHVVVVRCLVEKGADMNIKDDKFGYTPLHLASIRGHVSIVRCLVDKQADINTKDDKLGGTPLHWACAGGNVETVEYFLEKGADPTAKDKDCQTPLSWAIGSRHKDVAAFLLEQERWVEMLRSSDNKFTTPMRGLIAFLPDVAERAFSRCVTINEDSSTTWEEEVLADSHKLKVIFNYEFLEDFQDDRSSDKQSSGEEGETNIDASAKSLQPKKFTKHSHPLFLIKKHGCSNLMKHPLVISLLAYKWKKFGRYIFFGNLFIYLIFLAFLTSFGLVVLSPLERPCAEVLNGTFNGTPPEDCGDLTIDDYQFLFLGAIFTIVTAIFRLAIELSQLYRHPLEYLQDWVNWLEIPLYLCSIIFTSVFATPCLCIYNWQWQFGAVAVFLSWIGLISFLQKWHVTGVYILMFINVILSFLKIGFLALLLVIAFALAFYMLFFEPDEMRNAFSNPGRAIVKVMTMTTGELDYDEMFHQKEGEDEITFPLVSFILWIIFLVLIPVLLSNMLVGLAVGDVDSRLKTAFQNRIELQIDLILTYEELLKSWPVKQLFDLLCIRCWYLIQKSRTVYPNTPETLLPNWCKGDKNDEDLARFPGYTNSDKARRWVAKRYAKWWVPDDYSTSGMNIFNQVNPAQDPTEKQLQQQSDQLAKLQQQGEEQVKQLEAKLQQHFQEAIKELSEKSEEQAAEITEQTKEMTDQTKEMKEQTALLAGEVATLREGLEAKLQQDIQEAIIQLSEKSKEQMREQTKEMKEQTAQLAAEVATLREALQKLLTKMNL